MAPRATLAPCNAGRAGPLARREEEDEWECVNATSPCAMQHAACRTRDGMRDAGALISALYCSEPRT